ncbi:hypothetical protein GCM10009795_040160 [Nocardioides hankookensis]|uniref:Uncharacterized protein n=1 Tax=Nocardioides hankookensis TaxID=443157 RepID=A0ABW1LRG5_9ACTN
MTIPLEHVEVLRDEISSKLTELGMLLDLVRDLVDAPQRSLLGFLPPETQKAVDELVADERRARRSHIHDGTGDDVGLKFLNADYPVRGIASPAPLSLSPASFEAYAWATLQHQVKLTGYHLQRRDQIADARGWCDWPRPARELPLTIDDDGELHVPGAVELAAHLRILCWEIRRTTLLEDTLREIKHLTETAENVVDGAGRTLLGECPHCHLETLVVYFRGDQDTPGAMFVRCGKSPKSGHYELCRCESAWCPCKDKPVTHRHTWWRNPREAPDPRIAHDWHDLASRLNIQRATKEPTP